MKVPSWCHYRYELLTIPITFYKGDLITLFSVVNNNENLIFEKSTSFTRQWRTPSSAILFHVPATTIYYVFFDKPIQGYDGFTNK